MVKNKSNLPNDEILNPLIGLAKVSDLDSVINPPKSKRKYIKKNSTSKPKSTGQLEKSKPKERKLNSEMYVDFPRNSNDKPSKITQIVQLMGFLSVFAPNRELLRSIWKLIKAFISVAFTLSAMYAACLIYFNIIEWVLYYLKIAFKHLLVTFQSYLPELFRFEIVRKALPWILGDDMLSNTPKYVPNFIYKIWVYIYDRSLLRLFMWVVVSAVVLLFVSRVTLDITRFVAYAKSLPGAWTEQLSAAFKDYLVYFYERCKSIILAFLSFFRGGVRPGTGWLNLLWFFQSAAEKRNNDEILAIWRKARQPAGRLEEIVAQLEEYHASKHEIVVNTSTIQELVTKGRRIQDDFNRRISKFKMKLAESQDLREASFINELLQREESHYKGVNNNFKLMLGFFGQPTVNQDSTSSTSESSGLRGDQLSGDQSRPNNSQEGNNPDIDDYYNENNKNRDFFNDPNKDGTKKK